MDEKTPHLHLVFIPLTPDKHLSAKKILGNRARLSRWQDEFYEYMAKAFPDLERGESARTTGRRHIPTRIFKQAVHLTKQMDRIQAALDGINPLNARKKRDEVVALLHDWLPSMESFLTQLKKYKIGYDDLKRENAYLAEKAAANSERKLAERMELAKLESDLINLRRFVDAIPDDLKKEIRAMQKHKQKNR